MICHFQQIITYLSKSIIKINKYKDPEKETEKKMWHLKTTTVSVIEGALGMIKKKADTFTR